MVIQFRITPSLPKRPHFAGVFGRLQLENHHQIAWFQKNTYFWASHHPKRAAMFLINQINNPEKLAALYKKMILQTYKSRNIILPRIAGRHEKVSRHIRITYSLIRKRKLGPLARFH